ncbi:unnamed protein product, partial [Mesorhabditis spiculigera]
MSDVIGKNVHLEANKLPKSFEREPFMGNHPSLFLDEVWKTEDFQEKCGHIRAVVDLAAISEYRLKYMKDQKIYGWRESWIEHESGKLIFKCESTKEYPEEAAKEEVHSNRFGKAGELLGGIDENSNKKYATEDEIHRSDFYVIKMKMDGLLEEPLEILLIAQGDGFRLEDGVPYLVERKTYSMELKNFWDHPEIRNKLASYHWPFMKLLIFWHQWGVIEWVDDKFFEDEILNYEEIWKESDRIYIDRIVRELKRRGMIKGLQ